MPSPTDLLAPAPSNAPRLFLLTAPRGAGKTTWCLSFAATAARHGRQVSGLVSPAVFENGEKTGIDLFDLSTGERKSLALRSPQAIQGLMWKFDQATLRRGNEILRQIEAADILILDELGPLELERGQGLTYGLELTAARRYRLACVVVRPALIPLALERWAWAQVLDLQAAQP